MKIKAMFPAMAIVVSGWFTGQAQVIEAEVPGDHFSLEGALELFKESRSPEEFERMLNDPETKVNNLDLNGDGYIDYIRVIDRYEGNVHVFILQAVVSASENQDIAVIELEKLENGRAVLQIVGDPDIYGIETIIEPTSEVRMYAGSVTTRNVVNVWHWPIVRYVYSPTYVVYHSPWGWHYRPVWWRPWRPVVYVDYYTYWEPFWGHYSFCHTRRVVYAHHIYHPHRTTSVVVVNRYRPQVVKVREQYSDGAARRNSRSSSGSIDRESGSRSSRTGTVDANGSRTSSSGRESRSGRLSQSRSENSQESVRKRSGSETTRSGSGQGSTPTDNDSFLRERRTSPAKSRSEVRSVVDKGTDNSTPVYRRSTPSQSESAPSRSSVAPRESGSSPSRSTITPSRSSSNPTRSTASPSRSSSSPSLSPSRSSSSPSRSTTSPSRSSSSPSVSPSRSTSSPSRSTVSPSRSSSPSVSPGRSSSPSRSTPSPSKSGGSRSRDN